MVDKYANIATLEVTLSAANTLTFQEMQTNLGIDPDRKKAVAMIIDEIDYLPGTTSLTEMTAANDRIDMSITISNNVPVIVDITDRRILHSATIVRLDGGTAGNFILQRTPFSYQFFPPLITAEKRIYLGCMSAGLASAMTLRCRIYYRTVAIDQADFIELAEVFRLVG